MVPCKYATIGCKEIPIRKDLQQRENDTNLHLHLAIETINEQQKMIVMDDYILAVQAGPCAVFKFQKYQQYKTSKQEWYSPPFYTHPGGYKICMRVDANGNDEGENTYVSVYACLMKGRNDDNLPWPFTGEVTVTLLNQLEDENHHTDTVSFPEDSDETNERVVDDERAAEGYGWDEFISHDELDFDAENNRQYLKDDCLFFKIEVEAAQPVKPWLTCTA